MNIVFEGVDKAGKTSLINEFVRRRFSEGEEWYPVKFSNPVISKRIQEKWVHDVRVEPIMQAETLSEYFGTFKLMKAARLNHLLFDRFFLGEFIYCNLRGYRYIKSEEGYWIDIFNKLMRETDTILIYVKASKDTIIKRMRQDGGDVFTNEERVEEILVAYERILRETNIPCFIIDTDNLAIPQVCDVLEAILNPFKESNGGKIL